MSFRSTTRGWVGEHGVSALLAGSLDRDLYTRFDNIIVPTANGTTQIDHIVVSRFGIFVVETKNTRGWIFGHEREPKWTQVLFGKKCQFQNPLRQNYGHTSALAELLLLDHMLFQSIVFFAGTCEFKTPMPKDVMTSGLIAYIRQFQSHCVDEAGVAHIVQELRSLKVNPTLTQRIHVAGLRERSRTTL
jgi:restriction system protein